MTSSTYYVERILEFFLFFFQAEDGIRDADVTGVQTCALPICFLHKTVVGAAAIAPTAAAPTAVLCKKLRLVIFDFLSSGIRIPLLWRRWGGTQTPYATGPRHRPAA